MAVLMVSLTGCERGDTLERFSGPTMGSSYSVQYVRKADGPAVEQVREQVEAILAEVDHDFSTYRSDSVVGRFNALPANSCQAMPAAVLQLFGLGEWLYRESGGAFDLTVEPLLDLWGFGPQSRREQVPTAQALLDVRRRVGQQHLRLSGESLCKDAPVELDFNSIAAGYTVDRMAAQLQAMGVEAFLVEATGELKAVGRKPDGSAWRVALQAPRDDRQELQQMLAVDGYGVSTSGDYRHYFEQGGRRYSHTFDARSGMPVEHALASVTVLEPSAAMADGLSTLLLILGPEEGWDYALKHDIAALFVTRADKLFVTRATPAFERMTAAVTVK
ncbi:FAD:protein FMN transferase [Pseudomonas sp. R5(2019)]|uniref:FAD:protein FMN transferase n=1 Tax=Pseudomonas sp. R5(2019) TaxID=2697566 RepID=UPI0035322513